MHGFLGQWRNSPEIEIVAVAEPAMLFLMAGLIGTIVISMLLPVFTMQELIH